MYEQSLHIQEAPADCLFGHRRQYRYRVLGKKGETVIHHTNSLEDAVQYFRKCRDYWLSSQQTHEK